jgi:sulfur-carrier protein
MATVYIPTIMRRLTNGEASLKLPGRTVGELIGRLQDTHPGLWADVCDQDGRVKVFIAVFVNGTHMRDLNAMETAIDDRDEVHMIPAMAGG